MLHKSSLFVVVLVFSGLVLGQQPADEEAAGNAPNAQYCYFTSYVSGSGMNQTQYCVGFGGNIVQFSRPSNTEYINWNLSTMEGYGICDLTSSSSYYDYASKTSGNWETPVFTKPSATKLKLVRTTSDGVWELTQVITQVKAKGSSPGAAQITMSLKNLSGSARDVYLLRVGSVSGNYPDSWRNYFDFTWNIALGSFIRDDRLRFGLSLTNNTFNFPHYGFTQSTPKGPDPCLPSANWNWEPYSGQGSIGHLYHHSLRPGSTMTVSMTYRPM